MNSKEIYDLTDAATTMVASLVFRIYLSDGGVDTFDRFFSEMITTDQRVPAGIKSQARIPTGLPFLIVSGPVFGGNKKAIMDALKKSVRVTGPALRTLKELPALMNLYGSAAEAKFEELITVTSSKLFELCFGRYCVKAWQGVVDRSLGNAQEYGLVLFGD